MLEIGGKHEIFEAENGKEGFTLAAQKVFDVVLIDINMAGLDGEATLMRLRSLPNYRRCRLIAFTASTGIAERMRYVRQGFDAVLGKPFSMDELLHSLT